ncbi:uncharacterized protein MONOS_6429 [Monocercomonoides exilis]|uniref:uncharacterized protein n=1 Tax=Monocercomonoides exilis TaxID=2049356 RepID=UPI00355A8C34|nr:hypothetical protein MONOS_6429 [Monocercomonoides exilis]|eukprot:MONOS_6429.1-p1 / transcript=MONOS_6429.1 / gene=MONOS_6429 / organism=Monocercomonoides_exilis_PA203 / gene_product=unspecified product / transcript_product=unspecified product / location=Mono_scaffold00202:49001-49360(+) / protein_length=120 / sequence_SO=supercontig / SO=protein_coding / is_pseudo=false
MFHHQQLQQLIANADATRQNTQPSSQMTSPQNSSIFASSASSASASLPFPSSSFDITISNVETSFTSHDVLISLQTSSFSPSADMQTSIGRNFECWVQLSWVESCAEAAAGLVAVDDPE